MNFIKANFSYSNGYLTYNMPNGENKFVARFKYSGAPFTKSQFLKQLIKNFTPDAYFHQLEKMHKAPLTILRDNDPVWAELIQDKWLEKKLGSKEAAQAYKNRF
jgi:hypothetical protein